MRRVTGLSGLSGSHSRGLKGSASDMAAHREITAIMPAAALLLAVGFILAALVFL
jgi:hypothetical protein